MFVTLIKWIAILVVGSILALVGYVAISAQLSLDSDYSHTQNTLELPLYPAATEASFVRIAANGYEFRARVAGDLQDHSKETVILLHGFPVTSAMWDPLMAPLAQAGYRVIAFDQRGYSPGARPQEEEAYIISNLVSDVVAVADAVGANRFHLIGHDWGSAVGWHVVLQHAPRILSWTGLSIAHPAAFVQALQEDPDQQARSGYFDFFVLPYLPEALLTTGGLAALRGMYGNMPKASADEYVAVFSEPGALTAGLNWYRQMQAMLTSIDAINPRIDVPSLYIWGNNDPSGGRVSVQLQEKYMQGPYREIEIDGGGHWLVSSHTEQVISAVLSHLSQVSKAQ